MGLKIGITGLISIIIHILIHPYWLCGSHIHVTTVSMWLLQVKVPLMLLWEYSAATGNWMHSSIIVTSHLSWKRADLLYPQRYCLIWDQRSRLGGIWRNLVGNKQNFSLFLYFLWCFILQLRLVWTMEFFMFTIFEISWFLSARGSVLQVQAKIKIFS